MTTVSTATKERQHQPEIQETDQLIVHCQCGQLLRLKLIDSPRYNGHYAAYELCRGCGDLFVKMPGHVEPVSL